MTSPNIPDFIPKHFDAAQTETPQPDSTEELRIQVKGIKLPENVVTVIGVQEYSEANHTITSDYEAHRGIYIPDGLTYADEYGLGKTITFLKDKEAAPAFDDEGILHFVINKNGRPKDVFGTPHQRAKLNRKGIPLLLPLRPGHIVSPRVLSKPELVPEPVLLR